MSTARSALPGAAPAAGVSALRDRKKAQTRDALIAHAIALFNGQGFGATTVEDIAAAADYSPRTFFRHFGSKEDVVFHDLDRRLVELRVRLDEIPEEDALWPAMTDAMLRLGGELIGEDPELGEARIRLWFTEPALRARYTEITMQWEDALAEFLGRRTGHHPDLDLPPRVGAVAATSALRIAMQRRVLHGGDLMDLAAEAFRLLNQGRFGESRNDRS